MIGSLTVLHAGAGDVELRAKSPTELAKVLDTAEEMLKRGFAVLVRLPGTKTYRRVVGIDRERAEYVLKDKTVHPLGVPVQKAKAVAVGRSAGG